MNQEINKRYASMEILGQGGMGTVYHAIDRLTGEHVALKKVIGEKINLPNSSPSEFDFRVALTREFSVLASLRHPFIISVLDYGFDHDKDPYFTMNLLSNHDNIVQASQGLPLAQRLENIVQMLEALKYLHRKGIIHRDLKPENVMVANGKVQVLDFGLATIRQSQAVDTAIVGTLAYIAPEVLREEGSSYQSDIYTAGLIAYELLTGTYPYNRSDIGMLVQDVLTTMPEMSRLEDMDTLGLINTPLSVIIQRMLLKDPADRYKDVGTVLNEFYNRLSIDVVETNDVRESFLQSAKLVGRDAELALLTQAIELLDQEQGNLILLGGLSGSGKSRLTDEVRIKALVKGALVVRGQAVAEGSYPFQLWREILRRLVLETDLSDMDASILKPIVPDIDKLLSRTIPDAPEIGAVASHNRLLNTIINLILAQEKPLVILLEDLQWSSESIELLKQLFRQIAHSPILVIANYRSNEMPNLQAQFEGAQHIRLEAFDAEKIADLSMEIIGIQGRNPALVETLKSESSGNIMFIIEVIRALAIEFGKLDAIGTLTLPGSLLGGGIKRVIRHRVSNLAEPMQNMLRMAAVLGKRIDVPVLKQLYGDDAIDTWLQTCGDLVLLVIQDENWLFAHDSIRETLIESLNSEERKDYYQQAAEGLEWVYGDSASPARLSYYWQQVGHLDLEAKYTWQAALAYFNTGAFAEASQFLERLIVLYGMGVAHRPIELARCRRMLGTAYFELGQQKQAFDTLLVAVGDVERPVPTDRRALTRGLVSELIRQVGHRLSPFSLESKSADEREAGLETALAFNQIAEVALAYGDAGLVGLYASIRGLNTAERVGPSVPLAYSYSGMSWFAAAAGLKGVAKSFLALADKTIPLVNEARAITISHFPMAITYTGWGDWERARETVTKCIDTANEVGDWRSWRQALGLLGDINYFTGQYSAAFENYQLCFNSSQRVGDFAQMAVQTAIQGRNLIMMGRWKESLESANSALQYTNPSSMAILNVSMVQIMDSMRLGDVEKVRLQGELLFKKVKENPLKIYVHFDAYAALAEAWLFVLAKAPQDEVNRKAQESLKLLKGFSRTYPIAQARYHSLMAYYQQLNQKPKLALNEIEQALRSAKDFNMPYEEGLAYLYRSIINGTSEDNAQAEQIFRKLESGWGLHLWRENRPN